MESAPRPRSTEQAADALAHDCSCTLQSVQVGIIKHSTLTPTVQGIRKREANLDVYYVVSTWADNRTGAMAFHNMHGGFPSDTSALQQGIEMC